MLFWTSCTKMSPRPFVSPGTRSLAKLEKATKRPSEERDGKYWMELSPWDCAPPEATLTRVVTPLARSCTKTSQAPFVSPGTRLVAALEKATRLPSAESAGAV